MALLHGHLAVSVNILQVTPFMRQHVSSDQDLPYRNPWGGQGRGKGAGFPDHRRQFVESRSEKDCRR